MFVDRVTSHCCNITRKFLDANKDTNKLEHFPVGAPNLIQNKIAGGPGKYIILSCYYPILDNLKDTICTY